MMTATLVTLLPLLPIFLLVAVIIACGRAMRDSEARAHARYSTWMAAHMRTGAFAKCAHPDCPSCPDVTP